MKKISALLVAGLLVSTALVGCGASPTAPAKDLRNRMPVQGAVAQPGQGAVSQTNADPKVQALLKAVSETNQRATGFSATIDTFDKGAEGSANQTLKVAFKKPNSLKISIMKDTGGNDGVQALWAGSSTMQVKPKFPPMAVSLDVNDKRLVSRNGWSIKDTGVSAILNVLLSPQSQLKRIPDQNINGKMLAMVEVHSPQSPKGATHEVIGVDRTTNLPAYRAVYKGQEVLYRLTIKSISMKAPSASEMAID